jgi:hypothetical protein
MSEEYLITKGPYPTLKYHGDALLALARLHILSATPALIQQIHQMAWNLINNYTVFRVRADWTLIFIAGNFL